MTPDGAPTTRDGLTRAFRDRFGADPADWVRAPGRVNLIGEHTDYNDGFVMPMAIDREVRVALRRRRDRIVRLASLDFDTMVSFEVDRPRARRGWEAYAHGVAWALRQDGFELRGLDAVVTGDVPRGAGLSSSAALELAVARALQVAGRFEWEPERIARACQRAENEWVGVASGIMDQLIGACGKRGHALRIDCRDLSQEAVPLPQGTSVVVLDTGTRRGLVDSAYNQRRDQCRMAARTLGVAALRDVDEAALQESRARLDPVVWRRARHVVGENARTLQAAEAMRRGDAVELGRLLDASHASLRDDYEVSSAALDAITAAAREHEGCYGARMTGAGFGGCGVALVERSALDGFLSAVAERYLRESGRAAELYVCEAVDGAGPLQT